MRTHASATFTSLLLLSLSGACAMGQSVTPSQVSDALGAGTRSAEDKQRDAGRRPAEVVSFLGIAPGMTVIDLIAASGYYTEVLSLAVGSEGKVYAQNNEYVLKFRDGANDKAMTKRLAGGRLPNVERVDRDMSEVGLPLESIDAALTALNFHDVYNGGGQERAAEFLKAVHALLRPGAVLGIIDHHGDLGKDNATLHRIEQEIVVDAAKAAGFELEAVGDMLRSEADNRMLGVFAPEVRGKTDRFVLKLRKS